VALPEAVEARLAFRLARKEPEKELAGHGPHPLPFESPQKLQWREPATRGANREPDVWRYSLEGDAQITLSLSEGMIGEIMKSRSRRKSCSPGRPASSSCRRKRASRWPRNLSSISRALATRRSTAR